MENIKALKDFTKEIEALLGEINFIDTYEELSQKEITCLRAIQELQRKSIQVQRDLKMATDIARRNINNGTVPVKPAKKEKKSGSRNNSKGKA